MNALALKPTAHVVDVLGNVIGRDQPILKMDKALEMISLLGEEIFTDENVVFFDPFCKAGEVLLACAFLRCKAKAKTNLLDLEVVKKEIYESNRYFGMAPDERHHRLSLRTFLGNSESHNEKYNHIIRDGHYVSEEDGRLDQNKFEKEFKAMIDYIKSKAGNKKIVAVGNPPYQEADGGAKASAKPIYNYFVETLMSCNEIGEFVLVIPARWFSAGKGLDDFRERIMKSGEVRNLVYHERSEDVFPTVHVQGGVTYLNWVKGLNRNANFVIKDEIHVVDLAQFDIIPDDPKSTSIINKIVAKHNGKFVSEIAWSRKPFGLPTNYFTINPSSKETDADVVKCYVKGKKIAYVKRSSIRVNADKIEKWKVAIPRAYATGARRCTLPPHQIFLIEKGSICTETYNVINAFNTKQEALELIAYLQTDFARYLLGLRKLTQDIPKDRWNWVPLIDVSKSWNELKIFSFFGLTKDEQEHIKKKVQEWS